MGDRVHSPDFERNNLPARLLINLLSNEARALLHRLRHPAKRLHPRLPRADETGVAGRPEEYYEALRHSGRPRRPEEYFLGVEDQSIRDHLGERGVGAEQNPRSPLWSRAAYDRYLEWTFEVGTTPNGVFGAKLMWGYFGDFVSLVRNIPAYRDVPLAELLPTVFPDLTFVRVVRANKVRQAVSLWKAVQTATWREDQATSNAVSVEDDGAPPYRTFIEEHRPQLRFHYRAIHHLLAQLLIEEASWDAFFEHCGDQADPHPLRELRRRLRDLDPEPAGAPRPHPARRLQPGAADEETVRQRQRRLDEALLGAATGNRIRPGAGAGRQVEPGTFKQLCDGA